MIFGRWICKLLRQHRWSHSHEIDIPVIGVKLAVECRRCGLIRSVKRRPRKIDPELAIALARNFGSEQANPAGLPIPRRDRTEE